ncbi:MAG: hypothetical protein ACHP65_08320 [Legionellales bacterium]
MLLTVALVAICSAIIMAFSQEFYGLFKKIAEIKGALLLLPLALASWAVYAFDYWLLWAVYYGRECLQVVLTFLVYLIPFKQGALSVAIILLLTLSSVAPIFLLDWYLKKQKYATYPYPYVTSAIIWLVCAMLLVLMGQSTTV